MWWRLYISKEIQIVSKRIKTEETKIIQFLCKNQIIYFLILNRFLVLFPRIVAEKNQSSALPLHMGRYLPVSRNNTGKSRNPLLTPTASFSVEQRTMLLQNLHFRCGSIRRFVPLGQTISKYVSLRNFPFATRRRIFNYHIILWRIFKINVLQHLNVSKKTIK